MTPKANDETKGRMAYSLNDRLTYFDNKGNRISEEEWRKNKKPTKKSNATP